MLARRFKTEHSPLDWAVLIQDIADTGMSKADIAERSEEHTSELQSH